MKSKYASTLLLGLLALAATKTSYAAPPNDACSLLTAAQVSGAMEIPIAAGQHVPANVSNICGWNQQGSSTPSAKRVVLSIESARNWAIKKTPVEGITKTPAQGIGDDAIYIKTPGLGIGLNVKKGEVAFTVRVYGFPPDQIKVKERVLALNVLAKL